MTSKFEELYEIVRKINRYVECLSLWTIYPSTLVRENLYKKDSQYLAEKFFSEFEIDKNMKIKSFRHLDPPETKDHIFPIQIAKFPSKCHENRLWDRMFLWSNDIQVLERKRFWNSDIKK